MAAQSLHDPSYCKPLFLNGLIIGYCRLDICEQLQLINGSAGVSISDERVDFTFSDSDQLARFIQVCRDSDRFLSLKGWRDELYPILPDGSSVKLYTQHQSTIGFNIERSACPLLGIKQFGTHLNGFVKRDGKIFMWIAKRCSTKQTNPGMLDNMVGGGLSAGSTPLENMRKEAGEEAGIFDPNILRDIRFCGSTHFVSDEPRGIVNEVNYVFDIELPLDFKPVPEDGEVQCFHLWDLQQVRQRILNGEFTHDAALVIIDFFRRHHPEYQL